MSIHILRSYPSRSTILIRMLTGGVFLMDGFQRITVPYGVTRSTAIFSSELPMPDFLCNFIGYAGIVCGCMILLGLLTRIAVIPLLILIVVMFPIIKAELYVEHGFWVFLNETMIDWAMFWSCLFLLLKGSGRWAVDCYFYKLEAA